MAIDRNALNNDDNDIIEADVHINETPEPDVEEEADLNW